MLLISPSKSRYHSNDFESKKIIEQCDAYMVEDSFCVSKIGRVEAVRVSPDLKKIAYASFDSNQIVVFNFNIKHKSIFVHECIYVECELKQPHDFAWINNSTIVVANRNGPAIILSTPNEFKKTQFILKIEHEICNKTNAVCVLEIKNGWRLFFCSVFHYISYVDIDINFNIKEKGIYFKKNIKVPDGVAINKAKTKIAITSALTNKIIICDLQNPNNTIELDSIRPHGLDFISDDVIVSSGGNDPYLNFWNLNKKNKFKLMALSKKQFSLRGNETEGGIKGINFCPDLGVLFATCPNAPFLAFNI
jgi:WD40 repeat protein